MKGNIINIRVLDKDSEWCEKDMIMFYVCFQLLEDYVNEEMDNVNWDHPDCNLSKIKEKIMELYNWYQERKVIEVFNFDKQNEIDDEYFHKLIEIRGYLWS